MNITRLGALWEGYVFICLNCSPAYFFVGFNVLKKAGGLLHMCEGHRLTMTCGLHASISAKVCKSLLLCQSTLVAKPKSTAVENAASLLMEMLLTHTGQLLQTCFYGGTFIWFSAPSWGPSCCPFSLTSFRDPLTLLLLHVFLYWEKEGLTLRKGFGACGLHSSLCLERRSFCQ